MTGRWARALVCWIAMALLTSCAARPPQTAPFDPQEMQTRYLRGLAEREGALSGVDADVNLWLEHHGRREPGVSGVMALSGRDRLRLRVDALFGTALDLGVHADDVRLYLPRVNGVWNTDAAGAPVSFPRAGAWLVRAASATWHPPAATWSTATRDDSLLVLHWVDGGDSLSLAVGPSGLPRQVVLRDPERSLTLAYDAWRVQDGLAWPVRLRCGDSAGTFELTARLRIMWFRRLTEDRLAPNVPEGTRQLDWADVRQLLHLEESS